MTHLKIVHCANFSESKYAAVYYSIDRKLSNGLIRNGHFVYDFSYREIAKNATLFKSKKLGAKKVNLALLETLNHVRPHLLLLGHSELISFETLIQVKKLYPTMKIGMWWVDPIENIAHIPERLSLIDVFFATTGSDYLKERLGDNTKAKLLFFPNMCDTSIEYYIPQNNKKYEYDLMYIGRADDRRKNFLDFIKSFMHLSVGLFGQHKDNLLLGSKYYKTIQKTKLALNYSRFNHINLYSSDRIIQLTASRVAVISPRIPNFHFLFDENEVIYFDDKNDFKNKLEYYLLHDNERNAIALNGYHKAHTSFNSTRVAKFMLEAIFELPFSEVYEWSS